MIESVASEKRPVAASSGCLEIAFIDKRLLPLEESVSKSGGGIGLNAVCRGQAKAFHALPIGIPKPNCRIFDKIGRTLAAETAVTDTGTNSAMQGALLRQQLAAEEVALTRMPQSLTGYTSHGLNQVISRDGVGVSPQAILDTRSPR
jgi:hypothetical protein